MPASAKPSLRFFYSAALRTRLNKVLADMDRDKDPTRHAGALSSLVVELTEAGLNYYLLKPLNDARIGFVSRQTASFGMSGAMRVMSPIIRRIVSGANAKQLHVIARHVRGLM